MKKYLFSAVLAVSVVLSPSLTQAAGLTNAQVQAILSLLSSFGADSATISNVNSALTGSSGGSGSSQPWCHTFNANLTIGSNGSDVRALDTVLQKEGVGDPVSFEGQPATLVSDDGVFIENTASAVVQFQAKYGIRQTGYVGPLTRAKLNSLYGCRITPPPQPSNTFSAYPTSGPAPLAVTFSIQSAYSGEYATPYSINYGDGLTSEPIRDNNCTYAGICYMTNPHTYTSVGTYTAKLMKTVYNTCSGTSEIACADWYSRQETVGTVIITVTSGGTAQGPITVTSPNGGETWTKGTTQTISWSDWTAISRICPSGSSCLGLPYDIKLSPYYAPCTGNICPSYPYNAPYTIAKRVTGSSFSWLVASYEGGPNSSTGGQSLPSDGSYIIEVCQSGTSTCDSSDSYFTITSGTTQAPVISGVSGPVSLQVSQQGTWTVNASNPNGGNLNYSVVWGDEASAGSGSGSLAYAYPTSQQATFTHSYNQAGNYAPRFTVTNNSGQTAQTSVSVNVSGSATQAPTITSLSPTSGPIGTQVTIYGTDFTYNGTVYFNGFVVPFSAPIGGLLTRLNFIVPSELNNCPAGAQCFVGPAPVTPGTYNITVGNANGTSNARQFTVTSGSVSTPPSLDNVRTYVSDSVSGPWTLNGSVRTDQNLFVKVTGLNRNISVKACAAKSGDTGCNNAPTNYRDYTSDEWTRGNGSTEVITYTPAGTFSASQTGTYNGYGYYPATASYSAVGPQVVGSFTITSATVACTYYSEAYTSTINIEGGQDACMSWCSSYNAESGGKYTCTYAGTQIWPVFSVLGASTKYTYTWSNDLQVGSPYTADVKALQTALTMEGLFTGEITGGFYSQTFNAVKDFQQKYGIETTGYVGAITRAKLNDLY